MNRFERTELLIGRAALDRLRGATVVVAGLGAVGSYAVEGLARAGIGRLRLADFDVIRESNINRQLYALGSTIGRPKVEVARERVLDINPGCEVEALRVFIDKAAAPGLLCPPVDVVIDAIDSVGPKVELIAVAVAAGMHVISSMGAASRTDPLAIRVADISKTSACPLAQHVRKRLKRRGIAEGVRCVYSIEPVPAAARGETEKESFERGRARRPIGSLSCLTGIFGLIAAREAIARIAGGLSAPPAIQPAPQG